MIPFGSHLLHLDFILVLNWTHLNVLCLSFRYFFNLSLVQLCLHFKFTSIQNWFRVGCISILRSWQNESTSISLLTSRPWTHFVNLTLLSHATPIDLIWVPWVVSHFGFASLSLCELPSALRFHLASLKVRNKLHCFMVMIPPDGFDLTELSSWLTAPHGCRIDATLKSLHI